MADYVWDKGDSTVDERIMRFLAADDVALDRHLLAYDIRATKAHVGGLKRIGLLVADEASRLIEALDDLDAAWSRDEFNLDDRYEDGHSAIEAYLTERLGDLGRKVHTGRSRNDQVLVATRLYLRDALDSLARHCLEAAAAFLDRADDDERTPMPGYTHLQRAVPSTVGLWCAAFAEAFLDDADLIRFTRQWINSSPLGSAAGYGVNLPLDREGVARELGFDRVQINSLYAQNSRGRVELQVLRTFAQSLQDLRRFAWDLSISTTEEFGFMRLPDRFTTGSSIMPNKRNPDVVEMLRACPAVVEGAIAELQSILSLPSGYHRDLQATKGPMIRGVTRGLEAMSLLPDLVRGMEFDRQRMLDAITPEMFATDRAIELAQQGVPFREAYRQVAADLAKAPPGTPEESIAARLSPGGAGNLQLDALRTRLNQATPDAQ